MRAMALTLGSIAALLVAGDPGHAADPRAVELTYQPWSKFCLTPSNCFMASSANGQCTPSGGAVTLAFQSSNRAILTANFSTRMLLEGPISLRIDQDAPIQLPKPHCYASGCAGTLEADGAMIERLRRAQGLTMDATNIAGGKLSLTFPMADFAQAHDGPGKPPPKTFEQSQAELREMIKRAEKDRPPLPACEN